MRLTEITIDFFKSDQMANSFHLLRVIRLILKLFVFLQKIIKNELR